MFKWLEDVGWPGYLLIILLVVVVALSVLVIGDYSFAANRQAVNGLVVGKEYSPSKTGVGVGSANTGNGSGPVVVVTSESEKWSIVIEIEGDYKSFEVSPEVYYQLSEGEYANLDCNVGKIFGSISHCYVAGRQPN